jgi:hypothetical protein
MNRLAAACALLATLAACNSKPDAPAAEEAAAAPEAAGAAAPPAAPAAAAAAFAAGTIVEATRQTQCHEIGPNAGEPWDVSPGSFAKVIAVQGDQILVDMAATECLIPADAVTASTN